MGTGTRKDGETDAGLAGASVKLPGPIILQAVMGSHAYGMARPNSDIDRKGVYVGATIALTGLFPPPLTVTHTKDRKSVV